MWQMKLKLNATSNVTALACNTSAKLIKLYFISAQKIFKFADSQSLNNNKNGRSIDPKMGPVRKTAGVRNLPKIERKQGNAGIPQVLETFKV